MTQRFSQRHGHISPDPEITIREDAPYELRSVLVDVAYKSGLSPSSLRTLVCKTVRVAADPYNWSEYPNIDQEVRDHLARCEWWEVYDLIEEIQETLQPHPALMGEDIPAASFEQEMNSYFRRRGIGWQLAEGRIDVRGHSSFEDTVHGAIDNLKATDRTTASSELEEAIQDLSRRPEPDVTGAIQHAIAALECLARDVTGDHNTTLGKIMRNNPDLVPKPLDQAVVKAWGYASNRARHLREGSLPSYEEAELIVSVSGAICSYLTSKMNI